MSDKDQKFYVTTPIYYGNGLPHIGHYYSSMIADIIARYNVMTGKNTRFTTWIDENSQKSVMKAEEEWLEIQEYLDKMSDIHQNTWDTLGIDYTDYIRTTEARHHELVQKVLQKCFDKWDIYQGEYEWMYCVWCEAFKKDDDLIEKNGEKVCPDHLTAPDKIKEKNYFFKLSNYQTWIEWLYQNVPDFVQPDKRFNEVKAFVDRGLEDFSISRESITFGIPLPFDDSQVTYVWFDALFNYYTSCVSSRAWNKNSTDFVDESDFWIRQNPIEDKILHVVWKDIIRFHAIFWPAMLASYFDLWKMENWTIVFNKSNDCKYLPNSILTGGHFTVDWQKMSKSLWNVIDPIEYTQQYWKDLLKLYMLSAFSIWNDWDYDRTEAIKMFNAKLANNLWNLVNRVVVLSLKLDNELWAWISDFKSMDWQEYNHYMSEEFGEASKNITETYVLFSDVEKAIQEYKLKDALDILFEMLDALNRFADATEPWKLLKTDTQRAETILFIIARRLSLIAIYLYSFFPEKMNELFLKLWLNDYENKLKEWKIIELKSENENFKIIEKWEPLFMREEI